jgi:heterodisulfide reductase subunit C
MKPLKVSILWLNPSPSLSNKEHDHKNKKSSRVVGDVQITEMTQKPFLWKFSSGTIYCVQCTSCCPMYSTVAVRISY